MNEKLQSPVLKAGLVALAVFMSKKYWGYELEGEFVGIAIDLIIGTVLTIAIINNPNDRRKL